MSIGKKINIFILSIAFLCIISNIYAVYSSFSASGSAEALDAEYITANTLLSDMNVSVSAIESEFLKFVTHKTNESFERLKTTLATDSITIYTDFIIPTDRK